MTVPMYLAECSPSSYRGRITVLSNAAVTGGQFVAGLIDFGFSYVNQGWRYMLGITAVPSLMNLIAFIFLPESPRWLVGKGKKEKARIVLAKVSMQLCMVDYVLKKFKIGSDLGAIFQKKA